jgi:hypothetical protein
MSAESLIEAVVNAAHEPISYRCAVLLKLMHNLGVSDLRRLAWEDYDSNEGLLRVKAKGLLLQDPLWWLLEEHFKASGGRGPIFSMYELDRLMERNNGIRTALREKAEEEAMAAVRWVPVPKPTQRLHGLTRIEPNKRSLASRKVWAERRERERHAQAG